MTAMTTSEQIQVGDLVRWWPDGYSPVIPQRHIDGEVTTMSGHQVIGMRITASHGFTERRYGGFIMPAVGAVVDPSFMPGTILRISSIQTPVGDIPVIADPTVKPVEFRLSDAMWKVIGMDLAFEPDVHVVSTVSVKNGVFHIDPDPPDLKERQAARVAKRQREERGRLLSKSFDAMLDEHYPRDENGKHYIPRPPPVDWSKIPKTNPDWPTHPQPSWTPTPGYPAAPTKLHEHFVEYMKADARASTAKIELPPRPDGFEQSAIDAAKVAMLAVVPKRFK